MKKQFFFLFLILPNLAFSQKYKAFIGDYSLNEGPVKKIEIFEKDKKLFVRAESYHTSELIPTDNSLVFNETEYGGTITFKKNEQKIIEGGELYIQGQKLFFNRIFPNNEDYLGVYKFSAGSPFSKATIKLINEVLNLNLDDSNSYPLEKTSELDNFNMLGNNKQIKFIRNNSEEVSAILIFDDKLKYEGAKEELNGKVENEYIGIYKIEDSVIDQVEIKLENGKLVGYSTEGSAELKSTDKMDVFELIGFDGNTLFIRDSNNKITGIELNVNGYRMHGSKTK